MKKATVSQIRKGTIGLQGMEFRKAKVGYYEEEQINGNDIIVDFSAEIDMEKVCESDDLADTLNYAEAYEIIEKVMSQPAKMIEHVAARIIKALRAAYPNILSLTVTVTKLHPKFHDGAQPVASSRVTLTD
ncbi:MAG: dihydroneopterin aldolase [Bacteroidales bacterium]|nr:dihydroneopterin aldolase [Bacteroidales bacterium]